MTLSEAYAITAKMRLADHRSPSPEQREAKEVIYREAILPKYPDGEPPPYMEPDFNEGWH